MSFSTLPLGYCTNVHPGRSVAEVLSGLRQVTLPVGRRVGRPISAGLWLSAPVIRELLGSPAVCEEFVQTLANWELPCYTLNAFPYGDFHSERVKEQVYLPDWTDPARLQYTLACARVLARLLPPGGEGSISTVPLGFKALALREDFQAACIAQLLTLSEHLQALEETTGRTIRLAIEPEPLCVLETTPETIAFFAELRQAAARRGLKEPVRRYLGVCYDVCHQAVEFESIGESLAALRANDIRVNKVHITCCVQLDNPAGNAAGRAALAAYVEGRYLHQTTAVGPSGAVLRRHDLEADFVARPPAEFLNAECWRVHFHVPVDAPDLGPLGTTRPQLREALRAVRGFDYAPHLEVETYTWSVWQGQPGGDPTTRLIDGLSRELFATWALLDEVTTTGE
ncbi:MAG: metabolite traffic protein EboE [Planctomycetaceae bacterium]